MRLLICGIVNDAMEPYIRLQIFNIFYSFLFFTAVTFNKHRIQFTPIHHVQNDPFHLLRSHPYEYEEQYSYSLILGRAVCRRTEFLPWKSTIERPVDHLHVWYSDSYCTSKYCPLRCKSDRSHRRRSPHTHPMSRRNAHAPTGKHHTRSGHHAPSTCHQELNAYFSHTETTIASTTFQRLTRGMKEHTRQGIKGYTNMLLIPRARA